jgi:hypothetical protein
VTSAAGQLAAGQQAKAQENYSAAVARENAKQEVDAYQTYRGQAVQERQNFWQKVGQVRGQQNAAMAANGIDPGFGSGERLQSDTTKLAYQDATNLFTNQGQKAKGYLIDASNYTSEAIADKMKGKTAVTDSYFGAVSSILGAATQTAGMSARARAGG